MIAHLSCLAFLYGWDTVIDRQRRGRDVGFIRDDEWSSYVVVPLLPFTFLYFQSLCILNSSIYHKSLASLNLGYNADTNHPTSGEEGLVLADSEQLSSLARTTMGARERQNKIDIISSSFLRIRSSILVTYVVFISKQLTSFSRGMYSQSPWGGPGWKSQTVSIDVPIGKRKTKEVRREQANTLNYQRRHGEVDPGAPIKNNIGSRPGIVWHPPYPKTDRSLCGFQHPICGYYLCPLNVDWNDEA
jgi:hypothetical protein